MKILIVCTVRFRLNGITSVIMNYYRKMDKRDMQIDFVVVNELSNEYRKELEENNSNIFYLPRKSDPIKYMKSLKKLLDKNHYDIIHIHGNSSLMALETVTAKKAKVPVRIIHSHNTTCSHKILHNLLYRVMEKTYTNGLACGQEAGKWLFRNHDFELLKNGIDLDKFIFNEDERLLYRKKINAGNKTVIGHVGSFIHQKNHNFLIDFYYTLIQKDSNYLLLLISDGELMEQIKEKVMNLGIDDNVLFLGKTTEVKSYLQAMDIFVLPSNFEGLPVVLIEAQASGLPCIVSDKVSGESKLTELVEYLPLGDVNVWTNKILTLKLKERNCNMEKAHRDIIQAGYNVSTNANRMKDLYQKYLKENSE